MSPLQAICLTIISMMLIGTFLPELSGKTFILAVDPTFITYFGGSSTEDATKVAFDNEGNTILIGQTQSTNLPVT
ncbi:MAG: SBBP repeat-containing protein, partial [Promethearchaeota archaeon]